MRLMGKWLVGLLVVLCCLAAASCGGGLSQDQQAKLGDALAALERLHAATDIGVNQEQYAAFLIEAQVSVAGVTRVLPDGELRDALDRVMGAHVDAKNVWDWSLAHVAIRTGRDPGTKVIPEYSIPPDRRRFVAG